MKLTLQEYVSIIRSNGHPFAFSPRPGMWYGTCLVCREWRALLPQPMNLTALVSNRKFNPDAPLDLDTREDRPKHQCQSCEGGTLSEEEKARRQEERARYELEHDDYITLQCSAITEKGRRCQATTTEWDYANDLPDENRFTDRYWWVCKKHWTVCPHCDSASKEMLSAKTTSRLSMIHYPGYLQPVRLPLAGAKPRGRGLLCIECRCIWAPRLELIEPSEHCPVWGRRKQQQDQ